MNFSQAQGFVAIAVSFFRSASFTLTILMLLAGCASYDGHGLKPGIASQPDVRELMGEPAATWSTPAGDVWAYPRGPLGVQTFLVRFDESGKLKTIEPVLDEDHFAQIAPGMTHEDVLHRIGPPFQTITFPNLNQVSWDYHFTDLWGYSSIFSAIFDQAGRVVYTFKQRQFQGGDRSQ